MKMSHSSVPKEDFIHIDMNDSSCSWPVISNSHGFNATDVECAVSMSVHVHCLVRRMLKN